MTDIVDRLRKSCSSLAGGSCIFEDKYALVEAAAEIARLRARRAELEAALKRIANDCGTNLASKDEMLAEIAFARMVASIALKGSTHDPR